MKNKKSKFIAILLSALAVCTVLSVPFVSHSATNDPLITLSYLTEIILPQFKTDILAEVYKNGYNNPNGTFPGSYEDATDININTTPDANKPLPEVPAEDETAKFDSYELVELTYGSCLYANSVVELIIRPGSDVRAISPFPEQGIADITGAKEYLNGDKLAINSYCIIPRGRDGRGIQVCNEKSYILVRGEYYIG